MIELAGRLFHSIKTQSCKKVGRTRINERNEVMRRSEELGIKERAEWKKEIGYPRRSVVEALMFRYKTLVGDRLISRKEKVQSAGVAIKLNVLNRMTELGMPKSYKVVC